MLWEMNLCLIAACLMIRGKDIEELQMKLKEDFNVGVAKLMDQKVVLISIKN